MAIKTFIDSKALQSDVRVSDTDLDSSFRDQASLFASYAFMHYESVQQVGNKDLLLDVTKAKLDKEVRDRLSAERDADGKPVKFTEAVVLAEINRSSSFIAASKDLNEAKALEGFIRNALEAFKQRKDMLVSLGANQRQEASGELRMNAMSPERREQILEATRKLMVPA